MQFAEKLKKLRKDKNISQQALANAIFVSRSAVAKWENGLGLPSRASYEALIEYFGVDADYLKTDESDEIAVSKNLKWHRAKSVISAILMTALIVAGILMPLSIFSDTYGLTSQLAAGPVFYDSPVIHTREYDIYYDTMDFIYEDEKFEVIHTFRPVKKLFIGYRLYEEGYDERTVYFNGEAIGIIYSLEGKDCFYNIVRVGKFGNGIPLEFIKYDSITVNGDEECPVMYSSYFVSEELPLSLTVEEATVSVGE